MGTNFKRYPPETVMEAITLHDGGWKPMQIVRILAKRGEDVHVSTVCRWVNHERAEQDRARNRDSARLRRAELKKQKPADPFPGMVGVSRRIALLEQRVVALEVVLQAADK